MSFVTKPYEWGFPNKQDWNSYYYTPLEPLGKDEIKLTSGMPLRDPLFLNWREFGADPDPGSKCSYESWWMSRWHVMIHLGDDLFLVRDNYKRQLGERRSSMSFISFEYADLSFSSSFLSAAVAT